MGKSSFPTLLLRGYITAGASVTLERDTCWDNLWPRLLQRVPEKPIGLMQKERRGVYSGNSEVYWFWHFKWVVISVSAPIRGRSPPQVIAHQKVRERRIHPWDTYVSLSRTSLHNSSPTWYFHAVSVCKNSSCATGAAVAPLQGSSLSAESQLFSRPTVNGTD